MKKLEAIVGSPPYRDELVVQLFFRDGGQWGEMFRVDGRLVVEVYHQDSAVALQFDVDELVHVLDLARSELHARLTSIGT